MENLQARDFRNVLDIGGAALACEGFDQFENDLLPLIERSVKARSSVYMAINGSPRQWRFSSGISHGVPSEAPAIWCRRYQSVDPFTSRFLESSVSSKNDIIVSSEIVRRRNYVRTEFYADFLKPQSVHHVMVAGLSRKSQPIGLFGFHREATAPPFSSVEATKMRLLVPLLSASIQKIEKTENCEERRWIVDRLAADFIDDGVLILDENLSVRYISKTGQTVLGAADSQSAVATAIPHQIHRACKRFIGKMNLNENDAFPPFEVPGAKLGEKITAYPHLYTRTGGRLRFVIYLQTADGAQKHGIIQQRQLSRFKLTHRETDVARLVSLGMTNPEIAEQLFISKRTVQNHLRSIYCKVRVRNRTSLVARLCGYDRTE